MMITANYVWVTWQTDRPDRLPVSALPLFFGWLQSTIHRYFCNFLYLVMNVSLVS